MEGFGGLFGDPDELQRRMAEFADQMQGQQRLAWADNAIGLAVQMTVAAVNRVNIQGTTAEQAEQIRAVMATVFPEAVTLVREARAGPAVAEPGRPRAASAAGASVVASGPWRSSRLPSCSGAAASRPACGSPPRCSTSSSPPATGSPASSIATSPSCCPSGRLGHDDQRALTHGRD